VKLGPSQGDTARSKEIVDGLPTGAEKRQQQEKRESAQAVTPALQMLFAAHWPPYVVKSDKGSSFKSGEMEELFEKWEVKPLFSPSYYPQYNGACEAGIGTLKTYEHTTKAGAA